MPAASADHEQVDCAFASVSPAAVSGPDTYEGVAVGHVVAPGDTPTIRCEIWVNGVVAAVVDPVLCEVLKTLSPGVPPACVNEQGDVYVGGEPVWDCPPYDIWPPS